MRKQHLSVDVAQRLVPRRAHHVRAGLGLVAALSMLAGMTDAIGFLSTGDYVSFMSGNTTRLAIAIGEGHWEPFMRLALALLTFVLGNALGIIVVRLSRRRAFPLLVCVALLLIGDALWGSATNALALLVAILAMGMINASLEQVNGLPIGLTYVTGALSRLGRGLGRWLMGERRRDWLIQLVPWAGMLVGGVLGAVLQQRFGLHALIASGVLALLLAVLFAVIPRRWQLRYMPR